MIEIKVTQKRDGFHWAGWLGGGHVKRNGVPLGGGPFADAWEAGSAGHSLVAIYDPQNSYIVDEIIAHFNPKRRKK